MNAAATINHAEIKTELFASSLREILAERDLTFQNEDGLEGDELEEAKNHNIGLTQLIDAVTELHMSHLRAALIPVATTAMGLASMLWSATGNVDPFHTA